MERLELGPVVAMRAPNFSYVRIDAHGFLTPPQLAQILCDQRLGQFLATSGKAAVCLNAAGLHRFGTEDVDFLVDRWAPMLAPIGLRKISLVVQEQVNMLFGNVFNAATPRAARAGVEVRCFPSAMFENGFEAVSWLDGGAPPAAPAAPPAAGGQALYEMPTIIDRGAWTKAECVGIAFLTPENGPPGLGIIFRDAQAACWIFDTWRRQIGERDDDDILRVAVIEGNVPGKPPGYTLTIGPNIEALVKRAAASGGLSFDVTKLNGWQRRMNTAPEGSPHLFTFKQLYKAMFEYALVPVILSGSDIDPKYDKQIVKTKLLLRDVREIVGPDDPDAGVLA